MIVSRLTAIALAFAVFSTASLAVATTLRHDAPAAKRVRVVELERVVVTGKRLPREAR